MNDIEIRTAINIRPNCDKIFEIGMAEDHKALVLKFRDFIRHLQPELADRSDTFHAQQYFRFIESKNIPLILLIAYHGKIPVGYSTSYLTADALTTVFIDHKYIVLHEIFVDDEYRKTNYRVGRKLFDETTRWAKGLEVKNIQVGFAVNNTEANDFYTSKLGFRVAGNFARKSF